MTDMRMDIRLLFVVIVVIAGIVGCRQREDHKPSALEKITFAVSAQPLSAPVYVAQARGFFEREGLQVSLSSHTSGKAALAAVLGGKADFCTVAETPIMFAGLKGEKIYVLATIADSRRYTKIVARRDRGITEPEDLKGKRVGVTFGTNAEYFFHAYLTFNGIAGETVHLVDLKPEEMPGAMIRGDVDAVVLWKPNDSKVEKALGPNAMALTNEHIYKILWNIVARQDFVTAHPETVKKFLRALAQAERYIVGNPAAARALMAKKIGTGPFPLDDCNYDMYLGQNLLIVLEEQARWAIRKGRTDAREVPNFLPFLYPEGMEAVAPESVTVIHR
jgi:ABC-type nitrate/sulfonate/bicarbonate transport system substrate-binding protein